MTELTPESPAAEPALNPVVHTTCRICDAPLDPILNLGHQYLSDFPASAGTKAYPAVPLDLARCTGATCGLVQLTHTTPREWLYRQYWYRSGVNESMRVELTDVVTKGLGVLRRSLKGLTVGDIGANDGTLLSLYPSVIASLGEHPASLTRVAWEPARNLYAACRPHCEVLFPEFFSVSTTAQWSVDLLTMIACFYDIEQPHKLVADVARILARDGVWVVQQAYLPDMIRTAGYDNIVHEHLEYYHLQPLEALLATHGLEVFHVEHRAVNGGSFRTYIGWVGRHQVTPTVAAVRAAERPIFAQPALLWEAFAHLVRTRITQLQSVLAAYYLKGVPVDVYGASTKGNTLLQTCQIDARYIRQAWERSEEKYGRYAGVSGIPIVPEAEGRADPPAALLVLPWGFRESFVAREQAYLAQGGRLVFPLPEVEVVLGASGAQGVV